MKRKSRILKALAVVVALATFSVTTNGVTFSDSAGHWGNAAIDPWSNYGVLNGYPDGSFKPDASMTRAEMAQTLNALMKLEDQAATNPFKDMTSSDWFYAPVLKAVQAKYIYGYEDGTFRDAKNITRQEAMVMLARAFHIEEAASINKSFSDANTIGAWARGLVYAMVNAGIVNGVSNTRIDAGGIINRASVAMILHKAISTYAYEEGKVYTASGNGITLIAGKNITVNGTVNNMIIAAGASNSNAIIAGASISGKVWVDAKNCTIYATAAQKDKITLLGEGSKIVVDGITPTPYSGLTTGDPVPGSQVTYPYLTGTPIPVVTNTPTFTPTPEVPATYDISIAIREVQDSVGTLLVPDKIAGPYWLYDKPASTKLITEAFIQTLTGHTGEIRTTLNDTYALAVLQKGVPLIISPEGWAEYVEETFGNVLSANPTLKNLLKSLDSTIADAGTGEKIAIFQVEQGEGTGVYRYYEIVINIQPNQAPTVTETPTETPTPTPVPDSVDYKISVSVVRESNPGLRVPPIGSGLEFYEKDTTSEQVIARNFAGLLSRGQALTDMEQEFVTKGGDYNAGQLDTSVYDQPGDAWANYVDEHFELNQSDPLSSKVLDALKNKKTYNEVGPLQGSVKLKTLHGDESWYYIVNIVIEKDPATSSTPVVDYTIAMEVTSISTGNTWDTFASPKLVKSNEVVARNFAQILNSDEAKASLLVVFSDDLGAEAFANEARTAYNSDYSWVGFVDKYFVASYGTDSTTMKNHLKNKDTYDAVGEMDTRLELKTNYGKSYLVRIVIEKQ